MWPALLLGFLLLASNSIETSVATQVQGEKIRAIEDSLLSPCCYGGPVSTHMSDIAAQMRQEIAQMVAEGKSDEEIRQFYVKQYGERVLAEPQGTKRVILYALPVGVTVAGAAIVLAFLRNAIRRARAASVKLDSSPEAASAVRKKIRADLDDDWFVRRVP